MAGKYKQWTLTGQNGIESLVIGEAELPKELGEYDVLVRIHAVSLNARDVAVARGGHNLSITPPLIPCSDASGIVHSTGKSAALFSPGTKVLTHLVPNIAPSAFPIFPDIIGGLGHGVDGTLREYAVFHQDVLVRMPSNLRFEQAATLTCSGLTAWNALFGGRGLRGDGEGETVLVQGTGGVSVAALQFAVARGMRVTATTSSEEKGERLRRLGAEHVINYRTDKHWGTTAKSLSPNGAGISNVVDVGGLSTLKESMKAVCVDGVVTLTGVLDNEAEEVPNIMDCLWNVCSVRGVFLGTKNQFVDMVKFIEEKNVQPVVDERVFRMSEAKEAYKYLEEHKHFSKVVIKIV